VIARNTVFTYKDRAVDIRDVARELGVSYVLEGSVRRLGNRIRINAQLIDARTDGHLWADRFDRDASDIFAVQDEVIRHIVDTLSVRLSPSEQQRVARLPTTNLEAYDNYLRGEGAARTGARRTYRVALSLYRKAITLDPEFAQAFAAMARAEATVMRLNYDDVLSWPVARKRAYEHAGRALKIDPELSSPWAVLAELQLVDRQYAEALKSAERAVAVAPGDPAAHAALGLVLMYSGRHADAVAAIEAAERLDPNLSTEVLQFAGLAYMLNGQPEKAVEVLERARDAAPDVEETHGRLVAAYAMAGKIEAAHKAAAAVEHFGPNLSIELYRVKLAHFRDPKDLETILNAMTEGGLQKWPFAFRAGSRERLTGPEIEKVALGQTWKGTVNGVGPGLMQIDSNGTLAFRTTTYIATGTARVENDLLCEDIEALTLGRTICGPVYRADPEAGDKFAYTYVNASKVFRFTPVE
jgi:adenylate cyclase